MRTVTPINFDWKYSPKFRKEMTEKDYIDKDFVLVDLPHADSENGFNCLKEKKNSSVACYRRDITISAEDLKREIVLRFYGVYMCAEIYINGTKVFTHRGMTLFEINITKYLIKGKNVIAVKCDSNDKNNLPNFSEDDVHFVGICREAELLRLPSVYIKNVAVSCENPNEKDKAFDAKILLNNPDGNKALVTLNAYYNDISCAKLSEYVDKNEVTLSGIIKNAAIWDIDNTVEYKFTVSVACLGERDEISFDYGFRSTRLSADGFFLNGNKIPLVGGMRSQLYPYVGYAMPQSLQREDSKYIKNTLRANCVVVCGFPPSRHFIDKCDKTGLLIFAYLPYSQTKTDGEADEYTNVLAEMTAQYQNHSSVIVFDDYEKISVMCKTSDNMATSATRYSSEQKRGEQTFYVANSLNEAIGKNLLPSVTLFDFISQANYDGKDNVNYGGISDMFRIEKRSAAAMISQGSDVNYLEPQFRLTSDDGLQRLTDGFYVFTDCDEIKLYKNDLPIGDYFAKDSLLQNLSHPPIYVENLVGEDFFEEYKLSEKDRAKLKDILNAVPYDKESKIPFKIKFKVLILSIKYKIKQKIIYDKLNYYKNLIVSKTDEYKIEGYIEGNLAITKEFLPYSKKRYNYITASKTLYHKNTYDVAEVKIIAVSEKGAILPYCFDGLKISASGCIDILGPKYTSLIGGTTGIFVKSLRIGKGMLTIESALETKEIPFEVK